MHVTEKFHNIVGHVEICGYVEVLGLGLSSGLF